MKKGKRKIWVDLNIPKILKGILLFPSFYFWGEVRKWVSHFEIFVDVLLLTIIVTIVEYYGSYAIIGYCGNNVSTDVKVSQLRMSHLRMYGPNQRKEGQSQRYWFIFIHFDLPSAVSLQGQWSTHSLLLSFADQIRPPRPQKQGNIVPSNATTDLLSVLFYSLTNPS